MDTTNPRRKEATKELPEKRPGEKVWIAGLKYNGKKMEAAEQDILMICSLGVTGNESSKS